MDTASNLQINSVGAFFNRRLESFIICRRKSAAEVFYCLPPEVCGRSLLLLAAGSLKDRRTDVLNQLRWLIRVILLLKEFFNKNLIVLSFLYTS